MSLRYCLLLASLCVVGHAGAATGMSEQDYFTELPEVLTVTRLAQPISETPGAVTIIDRETIRRSGARELVDVLRLVPGYIVGGWNGANPTASYHAPLDDYGIRNLVMIDGRAAYSSYYWGDTHRGLMGVMLEDIERIEVLRGSNSAAYGANAMFGVINIITRHADDTHGVALSYMSGEGGIKDNYARAGWGNNEASFRLSTARRKDNGYTNAHDDKVVSQLHFRGDIRPAINQELFVAAGMERVVAGEGFANDPGNPLRTAEWDNLFLQGSWSVLLPDSGQFKLSANYVEETFHDSFRYVPLGVDYSANGRGRRFNFEFQHQLTMLPALRAVWGGGYKYDEAVSPPLYNRNDAVSAHEQRVFGNLEWRPHPQWLVNVGGFWGSHDRKGSYFSPRLMANFHASEASTFRFGVSESARIPNLFEMMSDVRYYPLGPSPPLRVYASTDRIKPEKLYVQELGYFGNFPLWRMTLDVRAYSEKMRDVAVRESYLNPSPFFGALDKYLFDFTNRGAFETRGLEYQLRWKPLINTEIWVNQAFTRTLWDQNADKPKAPTHASTLALFQKMPFDLDLGLMYHAIGAMTWDKKADTLPRIHRLDARLAMPFRIGSTKAEAALVVQAANGSYPEYQMGAAGSGVNFMFERRAFGTLRLEF